MKNKIIFLTIFALAIVFISCTEDEVVEPKIIGPTVNSMEISKGDFDINYEVNRDTDGSIVSIAYTNESDSEENSLLTFEQSGNTIIVRGYTFKGTVRYNFDSDSTLTSYQNGTSEPLELLYENGKLKSIGTGYVRHGDGLLEFGYNIEPSQTDLKIEYDTEFENVFHSLEPELALALLITGEIDLTFLLVNGKINKTSWGSYHNYKYSYQYNELGNLTEITRTEHSINDQEIYGSILLSY